MTPVEEIRRAAQLMRERATATSTPWPDRWQALHGNSWAGDHVVADMEGHPLLIAGNGDQAADDAEHVASWHPGAALAVADWLDSLIDIDGRFDAWLHPYALAVARAYLGGAT